MRSTRQQKGGEKEMVYEKEGIEKTERTNERRQGRQKPHSAGRSRSITTVPQWPFFVCRLSVSPFRADILYSFILIQTSFLSSLYFSSQCVFYLLDFSFPFLVFLSFFLSSCFFLLFLFQPFLVESRLFCLSLRFTQDQSNVHSSSCL